MTITFNLLLLTGSLTPGATVAAAAKWPLPGYRLVAGATLCAFIPALDQILTGRSRPFALLPTALLIALITRRAALDARGLRRRAGR